MKTELMLTAASGKQFQVLLLANGDAYGLDDCLTVAGGALVEFNPIVRDKAHCCGFRYYVKTILSGATTGLCLAGDMREYDIDAHSMAVARQWLGNEIRNQSIEV